VAVVLGGKNAVFDFSAAADLRLAAGLKSLAKLGASFLITPSRRTHERLREVVDEATRDAPRFFWDGAGDNPYPHILAHADAFVVTADSVNMTGEACSTGKPVYVFHPEGGSPKFRYFHEELERAGATRPFPAELSSLEAWSYEPIDASRAIAAEIERRWRLTHDSG
jgi:mitochondrial fission protein ELM1